jgi:hypothetical protein
MPTWTETRKFYFECSLTGFANDKIRAFYKINGAPGALKATFTNDAPDGKTGKQSLNETEKVIVPFKKSIAVRT